jgi:hypothetical protein
LSVEVGLRQQVAALEVELLATQQELAIARDSLAKDKKKQRLAQEELTSVRAEAERSAVDLRCLLAFEKIEVSTLKGTHNQLQGLLSSVNSQCDIAQKQVRNLNEQLAASREKQDGDRRLYKNNAKKAKANRAQLQAKEKQLLEVQQELVQERDRSSGEPCWVLIYACSLIYLYTGIAARVLLAERRLVSFHFGIRILESYFFMILKDHNIPRVYGGKRKSSSDPDEHDLWDVHTAMKSLLDELGDYVHKLRDDVEFEPDDIRCPLCPNRD